MELRQLRYFSVLAEELNFTRAAARLHMSQPPLSMQIAQLERELNVKLFNRGNRRVTLTEAGQVFLTDVRTTLARLKDASSRAQAVDQGQAGQIEIGLSGSHFMGPVPDLIARYAHTHPHVSVLLNEMNPAAQLEALREHRIDVSISRTAVEDDELESLKLWHDPIVLVLPYRHPLVSLKTLRLARLADEAFVMLRQDTSAFAKSLHDTCVRSGFTPRVVQTVAEIPAQLALVAAGLGVALVPRSTCQPADERIKVLALPTPIADAAVYAVKRKDVQKRAVEVFLQAAQE